MHCSWYSPSHLDGGRKMLVHVAPMNCGLAGRRATTTSNRPTTPYQSRSLKLVSQWDSRMLENV
jgi:hypothetical protein